MNQKNMLIGLAFVLTAAVSFALGRMSANRLTTDSSADGHSRPNHPGVAPGMPPHHVPPHLRDREEHKRPTNEKLALKDISKAMTIFLEELNNPPEPGTTPSEEAQEINSSAEKYYKDFDVALKTIPDSHFHVRQQLIHHIANSTLSIEQKTTLLEREIERQPDDPANEHFAAMGSTTALMSLSQLMAMNLDVIKPFVAKVLANPKLGQRQKDEIKRFLERLEHRPIPPAPVPPPPQATESAAPTPAPTPTPKKRK